MSKRKPQAPETPELPTFAWLVFENHDHLVSVALGRDRPLGEVHAATHPAACAAVRARWPTKDLHFLISFAYERAQARIERDFARHARPSAYHEAGHAVVGRLWFELVQVSILPRACTSGGKFDEWSSSDGDRLFRVPSRALESRRMLRRLALMAAAGTVAKARYRKRRPIVEEGIDREWIERYDPRPDAFRRLLPRVRRLVNHLWPQIEAVAAALVRDGEMSGSRIDSLLGDPVRKP
jgi:hypothetical protein